MQLRDYLKTNGIVVADFAASIHKSEQAVYKWISGERRPRDFEAITRATDGLVTANDFYGAGGHNEPPSAYAEVADV